tara:strand:+ start:2764 stop:3306 length:543 start_codon:yes stop_codon:yes gene_type:complete
MANSGVKITTKPQQPFTYQGNQVIINTDRVVMQSKKDSILMFAKEHISFSANKSIHFDTGGTPNDPGDSYFIINSPKIILGLKSDNTLPHEPVLLGETTEEWLKDLLSAVDALCDIIDGPENIDSAGDVPSPALVSAIKTYRKDHIKQLAHRIGYTYKPDEDFTHKVDTSQISSKNVFTI